MFESLPEEVTVYEVGPRDGLQNETVPLGATDKVAFIAALVEAGVKRIEATSFVHPKWIPQLADAEKVCAGLPEAPGVRFSALVPNVKGLERALNTRIQEFAIFLSASESHNKRNIHRTVAESLSDYREVVTQARAAGRGVRGYVSTVFGCPYEGPVDPRAVIRLVGELKNLGVDEVSLGDTIGVATPGDVYTLSKELVRDFGAKSLALHLHNTRGTALANVVAGLEAGIRVFDSTAGGLGGCPYAPGASGNLASEDLVYMLHGMGIRTGIDLMKLTRASKALEPLLGHALESNVVRSLSLHVSRPDGEANGKDAFIPDPDARRKKDANVIALEPRSPEQPASAR